MTYTYRAWNVHTGICLTSVLKGRNVQDAANNLLRERIIRTEAGDRILITKIDSGSADNHNAFGLFEVTAPPPSTPPLEMNPVKIR